MDINRIIQGDCRTELKKLPDNSIDCCVTSPPYFGLRDYGTGEQIGLEETPELFVSKIVEVFNEIKRLLKPTGTLWLNIGDSYWGSGGSTGHTTETKNLGRKTYDYGAYPSGANAQKKHDLLKQKDLIGIPWMVAFALRSNGWYLRQDIIWHKPNPMPESVTDRCTKSHEYIFLLTKSPKYYYDMEAIRTPVKDSTVQRMMQQIEAQKGSGRVPGKTNGTMKAVGPGRAPRKGIDNKGGNQGSEFGIKAYTHRGSGDKKLTGHSGNFDSDGNLIGDGMANKKSVWTVNTMPYSEAHFATFPERLIVDCIKAGCPEFVCNKCGKARERIIEKEYHTHEKWFGDKQTVRNSRGAAGKSYKELTGTKEVGLTDCGCNEGFSPGIVLDPFMGAGTTALVARKQHRNFIGIELNPKYIKISEKRLRDELGMFI